MRKLLFSIFAVALPVFAMAQGCPPSSVTATVTLQFRAPGMLDGVFTVSSTKKISFSQGNLQYQASTKRWRFAEHQWDYVGNASQGTVYENEVKCNNASASSSYTGWIDLFGWATSGNPASNAIGYQPYYKGTGQTDYYSWGPAITNSEWEPENSDWGVVNEVQLGLGWYTLSKAEWQYLLGTSTGKRTNAQNLRSMAKVNNIPGLILLPDNWVLPSGISFTANQFNYTTNVYNTTQWAILENAGAVFLPAAGYRNVSSVGSLGAEGDYWTSTAGSTSDAEHLQFNNSTPMLDISRNYFRYYGFSVRLVKEVR